MISEIPILAYHKISLEKEFGLTTISPEQFTRQIDYLFSHGYTPITFKDIVSDQSLPNKPVILTFDDGYECIFFNAVPVLDRYNYKAVVFVVADYIGKTNDWESFAIQRKFRHLSTVQIKQLMHKGWEIGSHGLHHEYLPILSDSDLKKEIIDSKSRLETLLNTKIISMCYPYGKTSARVKDVTRQADYLFATRSLIFYPKTNGNYSLVRRSIYSTDTLHDFSAKLNQKGTANFVFLKEWIIQKGALVSLTAKIFRNLKL